MSAEPTWIDLLPEDRGFEMDVTSDGRGQLTPYSEIARALGVDVSTVKRIERRALEKLRLGLRSHAPELGGELMQAQRRFDHAPTRKPTARQMAAWQRASAIRWQKQNEEARAWAERRASYAEARRAIILEDLSKSLPSKAAERMIEIVRAIGPIDLFAIVRGLESRGLLTEGEL